jgi:hypothetical protein
VNKVKGKILGLRGKKLQETGGDSLVRDALFMLSTGH